MSSTDPKCGREKRFRLYDIAEDLQLHLGVGGVEEVPFVEQSLEAFTHRDGVHFANHVRPASRSAQFGRR